MPQSAAWPRPVTVQPQEQNERLCRCCQGEEQEQDEGRELSTQKALLTSVKTTQRIGGARGQGERSPRAGKKRRQREHSHSGPAGERQRGEQAKATARRRQ